MTGSNWATQPDRHNSGFGEVGAHSNHSLVNRAQEYRYTLLTTVYIGGAIAHEH